MTMDGPLLRPLTAEETSLVEAFPLPEGVPDALVNKAQLATGLGVSETTVSAWLRRPDDPLPSEAPGANGRSYQFRLSIAFAWMRRMRDEEDSARAAGDAAMAQLQMHLLGGETVGGADGKMSIADQRKLIELQMIRDQAARQRRELIRREDVVVGIEEMLSAIRDAHDALPDRLARELGVDGRAMEKIERACDDILKGAARAVAEVISHDDQDGGAA